MSSPPKISALWTKGLKGKAKEDAEDIVRNSTLVREQLVRIIDDMLSTTYVVELDFDNPNWTYRQANLVGQRKALSTIRNILNFDR